MTLRDQLAVTLIVFAMLIMVATTLCGRGRHLRRLVAMATILLLAALILADSFGMRPVFQRFDHPFYGP